MPYHFQKADTLPDAISNGGRVAQAHLDMTEYSAVETWKMI